MKQPLLRCEWEELILRCFTVLVQKGNPKRLSHTQQIIKIKKACSDTSPGFFTEVIRKKSRQKIHSKKTQQGFSRLLLPDCSSIKTGLLKGRGNGKIKAPGVTMQWLLDSC